MGNCCEEGIDYWIPAFAGMTMYVAGMTMYVAGMTMYVAGMTVLGRGDDVNGVRHSREGGNPGK